MKMKFKTTAIVVSLVIAMLSTSIDVSANGKAISYIGKAIVKIKIPPIPRIKLPKESKKYSFSRVKPITPVVVETPKFQSKWLNDAAVKCMGKELLDTTSIISPLGPRLKEILPSCDVQLHLPNSQPLLNTLLPEIPKESDLIPRSIPDILSAEKQVLEMHDKIFNTNRSAVIKKMDSENK